ncbi:MAG TPA: D-tyrosyl-tRNA(Tyr) deacylase [Candidatus Scatomonas pullistercoris]|uniref:D-aminoacyl-tRNA deacylase n=1 Tax=Candidatus Scatomonas pullistercoris TaxID=2840920 RepID=A0A9D1TA48_9FIRM|nr:D-tyrosyl-tRNA(Tyr) deacylase [Candidatus Scatomonas pullistercoris]
MKLVIQRVKSARVEVDGKTAGEIGAGLLVLIGVGREDTEAAADKYLKKLLGLRIFEDAEGKTNLSLKDVEGELLLVSQFTLYANCRKGNRPSFIEAGDPEKAEQLYEYMVREAKKQVDVVETGVFGAHMEVSLVNDGPFTVLLENL